MAEQRLRGAKLKGATSVPKNIHSPATFDLVWDSSGYFRPDVSTQVLTVPRPKRRGRYQTRAAGRCATVFRDCP